MTKGQDMLKIFNGAAKLPILFLRLVSSALMIAAAVYAAVSAAASLAGRAHIRDENIDGDVYVIGKKRSSKVVCVTNISPEKIAGNVIKRCFKR